MHQSRSFGVIYFSTLLFLFASGIYSNHYYTRNTCDVIPLTLYLFWIQKSYVILLETHKYKIYASEWFIIIYIWTFAIENLRSMALSTPCSVWAKIKNWHSKLWNLLETLAIIIFIIGFFLRSTALFKYSPLDGYPRQNLITNKTISEPELTPKEITLIGYGRAFYSGWFSYWYLLSDWLSDTTNQDSCENFF